MPTPDNQKPLNEDEATLRINRLRKSLCDLAVEATPHSRVLTGNIWDEIETHLLWLWKNGPKYGEPEIECERCKKMTTSVSWRGPDLICENCLKASL